MRWFWMWLKTLAPCFHDWERADQPEPKYFRDFHPAYYRCTRCGARREESTPQTREPWRDW